MMNFIETKLKGAYVIGLTHIGDDRGFFSRVWCTETLKEQNLNPNIQQINTSYNYQKGTLRGLHYQSHPHSEVKIIKCVKGSIFDVIVDVRPDSATYLEWFGIELNETAPKMLYVPEGFAHGYQAISDDSAIMYSASAGYAPESENGLSWNDPVLNISWPLDPINLTAKDKSWPKLK